MPPPYTPLLALQDLGYSGARGNNWPTGNTGYPGARGNTEQKGTKGSQGDTGSRKYPGPVGPKATQVYVCMEYTKCVLLYKKGI